MGALDQRLIEARSRSARGGGVTARGGRVASSNRPR